MSQILVGSGLSKRFQNKLLYQDLALSVRGGEMVLLSGANGCGKSTLMKILAGLERADGGELRLNDRIDSWHKMRKELRYRCAYLHQSPYLFDGTIFDNVAFPIPWWERRRQRWHVLEALEWSGMAEMAERHVRGLSGGEQQRVALARALISRPAFLLMDEPLANLDSEARNHFLFLLRRLKGEGKGLLVVSHETRRLLPIADYHARLSGGALTTMHLVESKQKEFVGNE